jgi:hypothetical protein
LLISLARVIEPTTKKQKKTMKTPILLFLGAFSFVILGSNSGCSEASSSSNTTIDEAVTEKVTPDESIQEAEDLTVEIDKRRKNMHVKISTQFGDMVVKLYDEKVEETFQLMLQKNHDYGEAWRDMRVSSLTDLILMKLLRVKQIEDNKGSTLVSEGIDANYQDMLNYAVFALILREEAVN